MPYVRILDFYLKKIPLEVFEKDVFYLRPVKDWTSSKHWFTLRPMGRLAIAKLVGEIRATLPGLSSSSSTQQSAVAKPPRAGPQTSVPPVIDLTATDTATQSPPLPRRPINNLSSQFNRRCHGRLRLRELSPSANNNCHQTVVFHSSCSLTVTSLSLSPNKQTRHTPILNNTFNTLLCILQCIIPTIHLVNIHSECNTFLTSEASSSIFRACFTLI